MKNTLQARIDALTAEVRHLKHELARSKQSEEALRKSEQRYQAIFEHTSIGLAQIGADGRFLDANRPFCDMMGYGRDELLQMSYPDLVHPDDREAAMHSRKRLLDGEIPVLRREERYLRKDSSTAWLNVNLSIARCDEGCSQCTLAALENIGERRTLQESLRRIATNLARAEAISPIGSWKWDIRTNKVSCSEEVSEMFALPAARQPTPLAAILDRVIPDERPAFEQALHAAVSTQKPYQVEFRLLLPGGGTRLISASGEIFRRDSKGKPLVMIGMAQDITLRREAERAVRDSEERFRQLFDNASDAIFIANEDGRYIDVNINACRMLGYSREELLGMQIVDLIPQADVERLAGVKASLMHDAERVDLTEWQLRRKDGEFVPTEISARFLPDGRWLALVRDISERKRIQQQLERQAEEINDLYENAPCGYHSVDRNLVIVKMNHTELEWLGYTREELVGRRTMAELQTEGSKALYLRKFSELIEKRHLRNLELEMVRKDGSVMPVLLNASAQYGADGAFLMSRTTVFDITKVAEAQKELRRAAAVFEHTKDAILITDSNGTITAVNRAFSDITGYRPEEVVGKNPRLLKSGRQGSDFYANLWTELDRKGNWQGELWDRRKSGELFPTWQNITAVKDDTGKVTDYISVFSDITTIKDTEQQLVRLAYHDTLTGLANRLLFNDRLDHALRHGRRRQSMVGLLLLDLDRFKLINDTLGHDAGDRLLETVAARLSRSVRGEDTVARLGGDEFAVVMGELDRLEDAAALARKIIDAVAQPIPVGAHVLVTSVSIGISIFPNDGDDKETLYKAADVALYAAKDKGRTCFEFYTPSMTQKANEVLAIDRGLRDALQRDELLLLFQPQVSLASGDIVGLEALLRWNSPQRGMQSPLRFLPVAEESNLIELLGDWVIESACAQVQKWREEGVPPVRVAINLSARQLKRPGFVTGLRATLERYPPMDGYGLDLEVTESTLAAEADIAVSLKELKGLGFRIAVDDFGTGYSSLHSLKQVPADILKIDRALIHGIPDDADDRAITSAIIAMGHSLGMELVAEGIETREQLQFLAGQHCDEAQGFLLSPPLPADDCTRLLLSGHAAWQAGSARA
ncbi:MAG TPA: PAS domain S-box protein [Noviherbaspirillum sp.]|nr:PAS domain S-box protein [Noviherbaspirillum sp.]